MFTSHPRPPWARAQQITILLVAMCLTLSAISTRAAASTTRLTAAVSSTALHHAIAVRATDRRTLAHNSSKLRACLRHADRCAARQRSVKHSRVRLAAADRIVRSLTAHTARRHHPSRIVHTPTSTPGGPGSGTGNAAAIASSGDTNTGWGSTSMGTGSTSSGSDSTDSGPTEGTSDNPSGSTSFEMGVVAGSAPTFELSLIQTLSAHTARMEFDIGTPAARMAPIVEAYARAGIRPLLLASFHGTMPTTAEAQNLASWAGAFGPGGTLWQGKSFPAGTAVTDIEFGNETSYAYQYSDTSKASNWYAFSSYAARAQTYALRFEDAQTAMHAANPGVGLLAQADDGGSGSSAWVDNLFAAVPDLAQRVAGWTIHPYGPEWQAKIDKLMSSTAAHGASSTIPIYVTEWGLATDNGRCLSDNYGWNKCMSYGEASGTLGSTVSAMRARYGNRLAAFYLFQARDQATSDASTDREGYFGALQSNETPKGAYTTTVQSLLTANP